MFDYIIFLTILTNVISYDIGAHDLTNAYETFRFKNNTDFTFFSKQVNWYEAYAVCLSIDSQLAVVDTNERADFLAQALSQTLIGQEDVWIGARFTSDEWIWIPTRNPVSPPNNNYFPYNNYPPWLHYPTLRGRKCLAIDRKNHWQPIFVELFCYLHRGFICEKDLNQLSSSISIPPTVVHIGTTEFYLYHSRVTWDEAMAYCKESGSRLAALQNLSTVQTLVGVMKRSRPAFENVWIGGKKDSDGWFWICIDERIPNETDSSGYPPWKYGEPRYKNAKECIILDHHHCINTGHFDIKLKHDCEEGVFIEEQCSIRKNFLCEKNSVDDVDSQMPEYIRDNTFVLYFEKRTWLEAKYTCEKNSWTLAIPLSKYEWNYLVLLMHDYSYEIDHVWVGGVWEGSKWVWLNNEPIPVPTNNSSWLPWCLKWPIYQSGENCLNVDRDSHDSAIIYGYDCTIKQAFVCQTPTNDSLILTNPVIDNKIMIATDGATHYEAESACKSNKSELIVVNTIKLAKELALLLPRDEYVWIGARRDGVVWRWLNTREIIPDTSQSDGYPPWENLQAAGSEKVCLSISSGFRYYPQFMERDCSEKLRYICEIAIKVVPHPFTTETYNNDSFSFYNEKVSWPVAVSICAVQHLQLVEARNLQIVFFILGIMKENAPIWINGRQIMDGEWIWDTNNHRIPKESSNGYPPWSRYMTNSSNHNCLLLMKESSSFQGEKCTASNSFVCTNKKSLPLEPIIVNNNVALQVSEVVTDIKRAKMQCKDKEMEVLDLLKSKFDLKKIMEIKKMKSVWLDVMRNSSGRWVNVETQEELKSNIPFVEGAVVEGTPKNCLTLELLRDELQLTSVSCDDFKPMLCYKPDPPPQQVAEVVNSNVTLLTRLPTKTFRMTNGVCSDLGAEMIEKDLLPAAITFFGTLPKQYKTFWVGATYHDHIWRCQDNSEVKFKTLRLPYITESDEDATYCLVYSREQNKLLAGDCNENHSSMCQQVRRNCPPLTEARKIIWIPEECSKVEMEEGKICNAHCDTNILFGPERLVCTKDDSKLDGYLSDLVAKVKKSYMVFMLDNGVDQITFSSSVALAEALTNLIILDNMKKATIGLYSNKGMVTELSENSNCYMKQTFKCLPLRYRTGSSHVNYSEAFKAVEHHIQSKKHQASDLFLIFFALRQDDGTILRTEIINKLKQNGTLIAVISIGRNVNKNICQDIASIWDREVQYYAFRDLNGAKLAIRHLRRKSKLQTDAACANNGADDACNL